MENILSRMTRPDFFGENTCREETFSDNSSLKSSEILAELKKVRTQINCAQAFFNDECDFDMIDACVYELEALNARHRYLMRLVKESGTRVDVVPESPAV